ncbi:uncharacterized protein PRCAT00006345001 [Priceomyces carsonii]|uniref:uncharacterized protein n=1 Tax=Priceomyces carsonii TaxID=28549 RepID=UPI002ED8ADE4|nr:unnamed protein product [Priceomyces carsonii]
MGPKEFPEIISNGDFDLGYNGVVISLNYFSGLPDPSAILDPNIGIIFKSLLKKDSITKEKWLGEFTQKLLNESEVTNDENVLLSWIQMYPKLAIDESRNVRALAHQVQALLLISVGGKDFSKYLKSCLPIWLQGQYDSDKLVASACRKALLLCFQDSQEKVDLKIWVVFYEQIVKYIVATICFETPESLSDKRYVSSSDLVSKYQRVLNGSIQMLIKLIGLINNGEIQIKSGDTNIKLLEASLFTDSLWDYLGTSLDKDNLNLAFFKTFMTLLKCIFSDHNQQATIFINNLTDPYGVYKLIGKKFIKNVKLKSNLKAPANDLIYAPIILPLWETLIALTRFPLLEGKVTAIKKNFWVIGGSKSFSRLIDYLQLGNCRLGPQYYNTLSNFFKIFSKVQSNDASDAKIISFDSGDDAKYLFKKVLIPQFTGLPNFEYRNSALKWFFDVYDLFLSNETPKLDDIVRPSLLILFDTLSKPGIRLNEINNKKSSMTNFGIFLLNHKSLEESFFKKMDGQIITFVFAEDGTLFHDENLTFKSPILDILESYIMLITSTKEAEAVSFAKTILEKASEEFVPEDATTLFQLILLFLNYMKLEKDDIEPFMETVPSYIEPNFVQLPLDLLKRALELDLVKDANVSPLINDYFFKLSSIGESQALKLLPCLKGKIDISEHNYGMVYNLLKEISNKKQLKQEELDAVLKFGHSHEILRNLLSNATQDESLALSFIKNVTINNVRVYDDSLDGSFRALLPTIWRNIKDEYCQRFLDLQGVSSNLIKDSLFDYVSECSIKTNFDSLVTFLNDDDIPFAEIQERAQNAFHHINANLLVMGNPLEHNLYLSNFESSDLLDPKIIVFGKFLSSIEKVQGDSSFKANYSILCAMIGEYISDFLFLEYSKDIGEGSNREDETMAIRDCLISRFMIIYDEIEVSSLLPIINGSQTSEVSLGIEIFKILDTKIVTKQEDNFYAARLYKLVLDNLIGKIFGGSTDIDIDFNKLLSCPLKLSIISQSFPGLASNPKLDRIKNYVFAEILGTRTDSQILEKGTEYLALGINFVDLHKLISFVPQHRLAMVLNQISGWLESSVSYDEPFIVIRTLLAKFLGTILSGSDIPSDKAIELSIKLVIDNFNVTEVETKHLELRYFTLKLTNYLIKFSTDSPIEAFMTDASQIYESLLNTFFNRDCLAQDSKALNQPVFLVYDMFRRIFSYIKTFEVGFQLRKNELYQLLETGNCILLQRIAAMILHELIQHDQQELAIEYQLQKSKLDKAEEEEEVENNKARLLDTLIGMIHDGIDDIEIDSYQAVAKYVWGWYLIFDHFHDITYSMRNEYVNQLKNNGLVNDLLTTIFAETDITNKTFLNKLIMKDESEKDVNLNKIQYYDIKEGFPGDGFSFESNFLLVHLYYLSFEFLGSCVQEWYKGIRDLQLKQRVEKFSIKYVSPIIITKLLEDVATSKEKLLGKDENLKLKINPISNEVRSVYVIDEQTMEMVIKIPSSYPLLSVTVEGPLRLGVKENQWKAWLLASQKIISLTNGSIMEAIELFNRNVNYHFSGFEECAICYSILHQDHSLPSKTCPTCQNKFHAACLYKWFKSSGSSTCPLCRSEFNFRASR